ncbi:MAG: peptidylprolyl isomerase [Clostridia bacterium]|nr:peptidylprolyl isomerase [Clostridia bacterium]
MKKNQLLALLLALVLTLTSVCAFAESEAAEDPIVGKAYGGEVTVTLSEVRDDFESMLAYYLNYYAQYGYTMDEYDVEFQSYIAQETVNSVLSMKAVELHAANTGYALTPEKEEELAAQTNAQLDSAREYYESYLAYYGFSGEELAQIVEEELLAAGYTFEALYENAKLNDMLRHLLTLATEDVTVTEEEVKAAFDAKVEEAKAAYADADTFISDYINAADILYTPEGMRIVQSIYFALADEAAEPAADAAGIDALAGQAKAEAVLALIKDGADFEETMIAYNEDTSTAEQLLAGYPICDASATYSEDFKNAAMALENIGDVSEVLVTEYGCFILRYAADLEAGAADYASRMEAETEDALAAKKDEVFGAYLEAVLLEANIEVLDTSALYHIYVSESIEPSIAYVSISEDTVLTDIPFGDTIATLNAGASLYILGTIGIDGEEFVFASVPGTEFKGFVNVAGVIAVEEETALAADNAALVKAADALDKNPTFTIAMNDGSVIFGELYPQTAPESVGNFISLANQGFYNGLIFHRVIPGFMIQGGDPAGNGTGGPGYAIKGEFANNGVENGISHVRGVISMARSSAMDSAGSQFFIMHADSDYLDSDYAAFGMVLGGIETVDLIASVQTDSNDKPRTEQAMREVFVQTYGKTYEFTKLAD